MRASIQFLALRSQKSLSMTYGAEVPIACLLVILDPKGERGGMSAIKNWKGLIHGDTFDRLWFRPGPASMLHSGRCLSSRSDTPLAHSGLRWRAQELPPLLLYCRKMCTAPFRLFIFGK